MKITKNKIVQLIREAKEDYKEFFKKACKKFDINPENIDNISDEKKKELFNYIDKNWDAGENETDVDEGKINENIKFNFGKMMKLIDKDKFLNYAFKSNKGKDKEKAENLFNSHVLGDSEMEKKYKKA